MSQDISCFSDCILLLSGPIAVGKTSVAELLVVQHGFERIRSGIFLQSKAQELGLPQDRTILQELGDKLDNQTDYKWIVDEIAIPAVQNKPTQRRWLIDSVRKTRQVENFRSAFSGSVVHIHLVADESTLKQRYITRVAAGEDYLGNIPYEKAIEHPNEIASREMQNFADLVVNIESKSLQKVVDEMAILFGKKTLTI